MGVKIQVRRGNQADLPQLDTAELGFTSDTERLYIGNPSGSGNILMSIGPGGFDLGNGADGYVTFYTGPNRIAGDNDFFWDRENNRLGLRTSTPTHVLTVDGYITPENDNEHRLGTPTQRWEGIHLGPSSLHISSTPAETGTAFDWRMGIDQTTGNEGKLIIAQGENIFFTIDPVSSDVEFLTNELVIDGSLKIAEISSSPLSESGFGKLYVDASDKGLHFLDSLGGDTNLVLGGGTGNVDYSQGADGYLAFFIAPGHIAGDNDLFFDRETHNLTITGGGAIGIGTDSPNFQFHVVEEDGGLAIMQLTNYRSGTPRNIIAGQSATGTSGSPGDVANGDVLLDLIGDMYAGGSFRAAAYIRLRAADTGTISASSAPSVIDFLTTPDGSTTSLTRMTIADSGNIGIGITSPGDELEVVGDVRIGASTAKLHLGSNAVGFNRDVSTGSIFDSGKGAFQWTHITNLALQYYNSAGVQQTDKHIVFDTSGRVGIGNASPDVNLVITETAGQANIAVDASTNSALILRESGTAKSLFQWVASTGLVQIYAGGDGGEDVYLTIDGTTGQVNIKKDISIGGNIINSDLTETFNTIRTSLDGYATSTFSETTFQENKTFWNESIYHLTVAADGYGAGSGNVTAPTSGLGIPSDGYLAFFTGTESIAGDNDLYWDRENNQFRVANTLVGGLQSFTEHHAGFFGQTNANLEIGSAVATSTSSNLAMLTLSTDQSNTGGSIGNIAFVNRNIGSGDQRVAIIAVGNDGAVDSGQILFYTMESGTNAEAMRISANGNVGIGQASNGYALDVKGGNGNQFNLDNAGETFTQLNFSNDGNGRAFMALDNAAGDFIFGGQGSNQLSKILFRPTGSANNNPMVLTNEGNMGIQTETPHEALTINGVIALQEITAINAATDTDGYGRVYVKSDDKLYFKPFGASEIDLTDTGGAGDVSKVGTPVDNQVGVWTGDGTIEGSAELTYDTSSDKLTLSKSVDGDTQLAVTNLNAGASAQALLNLTASGANVFLTMYGAGATGSYGEHTKADTAFLTTGTGSPTTKMVIGTRTNGGELHLMANNATGITVDTSQNVGIGILTPDEKLHVHKGTAGSITANANSILVLENDTNGYINFLTPDDTERGLLFGGPADGIAVGIVANNSTSRDGLQFRVNSNDTEMTIDFAGRVGFGTRYPHERITVNGIISLEEQDNYDRTHDGYGSLWAKSDGTLQFTNDAGTDFDLTAAASGDVTKVGTPADNQVGVWTGDGTLEGDSGLTWDGSELVVGNGNSTQPGTIVIQDNDATAAGLNLNLFNESTSTNSYSIIKTYANNGAVELQFFADGLGGVVSGGGGVFRTFTNHAISFGTNSTERMRLEATGELTVLSDISVGGDIINSTLTETFETIRTALDGYGGGGGDVTKVGTPVDNQLGVWTGDGTLEGDTNLTWNTSTNILSVDGYVNPGADVSHGLGTPALRWDSLSLGPDSLHLVSTNAETGTGRDWHISIGTDEGTGALQIAESNNTKFAISPAGNVGIGTNSPTSLLSVWKDQAAQTAMFTANLDASDGSAASITAYTDVGYLKMLVQSTGSTGSGQLGEAIANQANLIAGTGISSLAISTWSTGAPLVLGTEFVRAVKISGTTQDVVIGTTDEPNEKLTVQGALSLDQMSAPSTTAGYGKIYVKSDGLLYYISPEKAEIELSATAGGGEVTASGGADGYIAFFTGDDALAGDNDLYYDRANGRLGMNTLVGEVHDKLHLRDSESGDQYGGLRFRPARSTTGIDQYNTIFGFRNAGLLLAGSTNASSFLKTNLFLGETGLFVGMSDGTTDPTDTANQHFSILNDGKVGVGTIAPEKVFHIDSTDWAKFERQTSTTDSDVNALIIKATTSGDMIDEFGLRINFQIEDTAAVENTIAQLSAARSGADNSGKLEFHTSDAGSIAPRMTILPSGNVGIGIIAPTSQLHLQRSSDDFNIGLHVENDSSGSSAAGRLDVSSDNHSIGMVMSSTARGGNGFIGATGGVTYLIVGTQSSARTEIWANNFPAIVAHQNKNVGINTQSPIDTLTVSGPIALKELGSSPADNDGYGRLFVDSSNDLIYRSELGTETNLLSGGGGGLSETTFQENKNFWNEAIHHLTEAADGYGSGGGDVFKTTSFTGADGYLAFWTGDSAIAGDDNLYFDRESNSLYFTGGGNVGIGLNNPNEKLTIDGVLSIQENNAPSATDGYGKLYVLDDGYLHYKRGDDSEFKLDILDADSPPVDGYVITSDSSGKGTWQDPAQVLDRIIVNDDGTLVLDAEGNATYTFIG